jgi:hypothetical protein
MDHSCTLSNCARTPFVRDNAECEKRIDMHFSFDHRKNPYLFRGRDTLLKMLKRITSNTSNSLLILLLRHKNVKFSL